MRRAAGQGARRLGSRVSARASAANEGPAARDVGRKPGSQLHRVILLPHYGRVEDGCF